MIIGVVHVLNNSYNWCRCTIIIIDLKLITSILYIIQGLLQSKLIFNNYNLNLFTKWASMF